LARFNGTGKYVGWEDYLASLTELKSLVNQSDDNGKLLYASALMLKVQEDHTYAGALIASLSNPWGDTVYTDLSSTGYKAVWPRDFYQVSMALLALGDRETPVASFRYLPTVQVGAHTKDNKGVGGWFQQKSHVDGTPEWVGVQLDQTAMPILLGQRLFDMGLISKAALTSSYETSLKPAAQFLSLGGEVNLGWNHNLITPPYAQQERWEEQEGHSPSTTAAVIAGLMAASDIATKAGDADGAALYAAKAKAYSDQLETRLYTTAGMVEGRPNHYYLRISRTDDANHPGTQDERNGHAGISSDLMIDQGFIELVRYGVRPADDAKIVQSLKVIDNQSIEENLRVRYDLRYDGSDTPVPGFRRYGNDGYGDRTTGGNYAIDGKMSPDQRGRVWPIFTGERGHYELALAARKAGGANDADVALIRKTYVKGMELMANEGLMIPEQVYEGIGSPEPHRYEVGEGTDSATPLAWSHAEYIKLLRSLRDRKVWDENATTTKEFVK
jgi:glucoamylase